MCLFCVEKKGWSDNFASQGQYNQHYREYHEGTIAGRPLNSGKKRTNEDGEKIKPSPTKSRKNLNVCFLCTEKPAFENSVQFERHKISVHNYDYCKLCRLIGPIITVRYHIIDCHAKELCHICCSQSPLFKSQDLLKSHLTQSHPSEVGAFKCYDCDGENEDFDKENFLKHLLKFHLTKGDALKPMKKKRPPVIKVKDTPPKDDTAADFVIEKSDPFPKRVIGVKNESGEDCFAISVLHLLAQTELGEKVEVLEDHFGKCKDAKCLLSFFFQQYSNHKRKSVSLGHLAQNFSSFGVNELPVDVAEFLRGALENCASSNHKSNDLDIKDSFQVRLQWKFECENCKRFMVMSMKDYVLKIPGSTPDSLKNLLQNFLYRKACGSCKSLNVVDPNVLSAGKTLFVEVDRAKSCGDDSKELILYSLRLDQVGSQSVPYTISN